MLPFYTELDLFERKIFSLFLYFQLHKFLYYLLCLIIGIFFIVIPLFISYLLYEKEQLDYIFYPIMISLTIYSICIFGFCCFKFEKVIKNRFMCPPWERKNLFALIDNIILNIFIFFFFYKFSKCFNNSVILIKEKEIKNNYHTSIFLNFFIIIFMNDIRNDGLSHSEENNERNLIIKIVNEIFIYISKPLFFLFFYSIIKIILIKINDTIFYLLFILWYIFEFYFVKYACLMKTNDKKDILFEKTEIIIFFLILTTYFIFQLKKMYIILIKIYAQSNLLDETIYNSLKITERKRKKGLKINYIDLVMQISFRLCIFLSILFFGISYHYVAKYKEETKIIQGKLIFNFGYLLMIFGYSYIFGDYFLKTIIKPSLKMNMPFKQKKFYISINKIQNNMINTHKDDSYLKDSQEEEEINLLNEDKV